MAIKTTSRITISDLTDGQNGTGISSVTEEYYLSTSKDTQSDGEWSDTAPPWSTGMYMWTRSKIVYTNPSSTKYTTPLCDSSWEAINEIEIGGRNLMQNSSEEKTSGNNAINNTHEGLELYSHEELELYSYEELSSNHNMAEYLLYADITKIFDEYGVGQYTFSFDLKSSISGNVLVYIDGGEKNNQKYWFESKNIQTTTEYARYSMTTEVELIDKTNLHTNISFFGGLNTNVIPSVKNIKIEKGNKATDWTPAPEDVQAEIDGKVNSDDLQNVQEKVGDLTGAVGNKAEKSDLQSLVDDFLARNKTIASDKATAEANLSALEARTASVELEFGETKSVVTFVDTVITESEEGVFIGDKEATMGLLLQKGTGENPGRISFMDNGVEVAFISGQIMQINHGIFVKSLTVGKYKAEMIPYTDILAWQFVG